MRDKTAARNAVRFPPLPSCWLSASSVTTRASAAARAAISLWRVTARSTSTSNPVPTAKAWAARL